MLGLRTQENDKFLLFWDIIQKQAQEKNETFFLDCGEGREFFDDNMEGEDLSGWLIPNEQQSMFEKEWKNDNVSDKWNNYMVFVIWEKQGEKISIKFQQY